MRQSQANQTKRLWARWISSAMLVLIFSSAAQAQLACSDVFQTSKLPAALENSIGRVLAARKWISQYTRTSTRVRHHFDEKSFSTEAKRALQFLYNVPVQALNPIPVRFNQILRWDAPANHVFEKLWKNSKYEPTEAELATLKKYGVEEAFRQRQAFLREKPNWHKFRRGINYTYRSSLLVAFFLQLYFAAESEKNFTSAADYLANNPPENDDLKVEVLSETAPFPHVAIRIGQRVYSYGVEQMRVSTLAEYLEVGKSQEISPLSRVIQSVELKLSREDVLRLKDDLESRRANTYRNFTLVNDCATMIARALSRNQTVFVPTVVDASPSAFLQYLSILKIKGDSRIGEFRQIQVAGEKSSRTMTVRNFYINAMETKIWLNSLYLNYPFRLALQGYYGDEGIEFRDPEVQQFITDYRNSLETSVRNLIEIRGLQALIDSAKNRHPSAADLSQIQAEVSTLMGFLKSEQEVILQTPGMDLIEKEGAEERLLVLGTIESEFLEKIRLLGK